MTITKLEAAPTASHPLISRVRTVLRLGVALSIGLAGVLVTPGVAQAATPVALSSQIPASPAAALAPSFTVPSGALFVATSGSDSNAGTSAKPFATLEKALKTVKAGGTIVVRGGTYRQGVKDPATGKNYQPKGTDYVLNLPSGVTVQNYPGETVWFDGTDVATGWTKVSATHYTKSWSTPTFCGSLYYTRSYASQTSSGPCSHDDAIGGSLSSIGDPMMAFRNGSELKEVRTVGELTASTFYYDQTNKVIHIGFDPNGSYVEITKRAQALAFFQPTNLTIRGLGFRRYGSNEYTNATGGAILINAGSGVTFDRVAISQNAGGGLQVWGSKNLTIRNSALMQNGHTGLRGQGLNGTNKGRDDMLIEYSRLDDNNRDRYSVECKYSCSVGGVKMTHMAGFTAKFSSFSHNDGGRGSGLWCDENCTGFTAFGNQIVDNARHGLVYEVSDKGIIASNLIADNGYGPKSGNGMMIGSANTRIYNNTVVNNATSVFIYDDDRRPSASAGPDAVNIEFANNIVVGGTVRDTPQLILKGGLSSVAGNTRPSAFMKVLDNNSYFRTSKDTVRWSQWKESWTASSSDNSFYNTPAEMQKARGKEYKGEVVLGTTNPFLVNAAAGDYQTKTAGAPRALPSDIASLLGIGTTPANRGVLALPSKSSTVSIGAFGKGASLPEVPKADTPTGSTNDAPSGSAAVNDTFQRTLTGSWGKATSGQTWTTNSTDGVGVTGSVGYLNAIPNKTRQAILSSPSVASSDTTVEFTLDKLNTSGTGTMVSLIGRSVAGQGTYYAKVVVTAKGGTSLQLVRTNGQAVETHLGSTPGGFTVTPGKAYKLRLQVTGKNPTTLRAKVWPATSAEPSAWAISTTEKTAGLQASGGIGVKVYQAGASSVTGRVSFDNLTSSSS
ncbi:MAG: right-handed parallel beta-helix repeat-containing protein [Arachnia sp.]